MSNETQISDRWWMWMAVLPVAVVLMLAATAFGTFVNLADSPLHLLGYPLGVAGLVGIIAAVPAVLGTIYGFLADAQYLRETNAEWTPVGWGWVFAAFVVTPPIAGVLYLWERNRRVGVEWSRLAVWRRNTPGGRKQARESERGI